MLRLGPIAKSVFCGCVWVLLAAVCCHAQQNGTPVFTLKVYANLVQVPALVLDRDRQPFRKLDPSRLRVSLDGGKKFSPTHVRIEGEDPLDLAILLDVSGSQRRLITKFADAAAKMAAASLHPQDRVSVYALNCHVIRSARQIAPRPELVDTFVQKALSAPDLNAGNKDGTCTKQISVWDATMRVLADMSGSPARRVLLVVSEGEAAGFERWDDLHRLAASQGVALFGLNDRFPDAFVPFGLAEADRLENVCDGTGGLVIHSDPRDLEKALEEWVTILRGRYVIEFPRPQGVDGGIHSIAVSIKGDSAAFVTLSGVDVPLPDPKLASDPHYLPSKAGEDIPMGNKRPRQ